MNRVWWMRRLPLEDKRDILARIGVRFLWATAPFFVLSFLAGIGPFGEDPQQWDRVLSALIFLMPVIGGLWDWLRLQLRARAARTV